MNSTGIIILAAGSSSRLGRPKQLLPWKGTTLLGHIIHEAMQASLDPIVVVTGAFAEEVSNILAAEPVIVAHNPDWSEGMASSIVKGISALLMAAPVTGSAIVAVCDQPFLSATLLRDLAERQTPDHPIVACTYDNVIATPALFHHSLFDELLKLRGDAGAKKIIRDHAEQVTTLPFPQGDLDIDTMEAYHAVLKMY